MYNFGAYDLSSLFSAPMWSLQSDHFYDEMTDFIAEIVLNPVPLSSTVYSSSDSSFATPVVIDQFIFRNENCATRREH